MEPRERRFDDPSELLAHLGWVQRLARGLVEDSASAEDVAQEALRVTLDQPPGRVGSAGALRAWLRSVTRKVAFDLFRSERSRRRREQSVARPEGSPDAFEVVERSARQARVAAAVRALPEPYRSTVLYRYLDEFSTREVAQRMGVSEEAVRQRLSRGLARLREKLDREFGARTRAWAVALLAPALPRSAEAGAAATAGALSAAGALTMGAKTILAAGAVAALAITVAVWRGAGTPAPDLPGHRIARSTTSHAPKETGTPEEGIPSPSQEVSRKVVLGSSVPARAPVEREGTLLRVTVVDRDGRVLVQGHLDCRWDAEPRSDPREQGRTIETPILGPVTEIRLPGLAAQALIAASVEGFPPPAAVRVSDLRAAPTYSEPRASIREVRVPVGDPLEGPKISGRILVDGVARVPSGLTIRRGSVVRSEAYARIDAISARYELALDDSSRELWVTSEETVPRRFTVPLAEEGPTLDLGLTTGRVLRLLLLDEATDQPLSNLEFFRTVSVVTHRSLRQVHWMSDSMHVTTDEDGRCVLRGTPDEGRLEIRRDGSTRETEIKLIDGRTMRSRALSDPIWTLDLTADMPSDLERTVRLRVEETRVTVFGSLPEAFLGDLAPGGPLQVIHAEVRGDRRADYRDRATPGPDGRWEFSAETGSRHDVWVERGEDPVSRVARVEVGVGETGPIDLPPLPSENVTLRLVHCPVGETARLWVEGAESDHPFPPIPLREETTLHRFRLDGPRWISLVCGRVAPSETGVHRRVHVDPAKSTEVEIDLRGMDARPITLEITGASTDGEGFLSLFRLEGPETGVSHVLVEMRTGRSEGDVVVPAGVYLFGYRGAFEGMAAGVVDTRSLRPGEPLALRAAVQAHARESLGRGVQFDAIDGVDLARLPLPARQFRWGREPSDPPPAEVYLPAGCAFTVLRDG